MSKSAGEAVKVAIIGGVFGLLGSIIGQLDKVHEVLVSTGVKQATHVSQASETFPLKEKCDDESDLGRIVLHSSADGKVGIFFCPQGLTKYDKPSWHVIKGTSVDNY